MSDSIKARKQEVGLRSDTGERYTRVFKL